MFLVYELVELEPVLVLYVANFLSGDSETALLVHQISLSGD